MTVRVHKYLTKIIFPIVIQVIKMYNFNEKTGKRRN